jgi:tetratricopeptide (TPR) repeat protein
MAKAEAIKITFDEKAKKEAYACIKERPRCREYYFRLARLCVKSERLDDAEKVLRAALRACPGDRLVQEQLAQLYMDKGATAKAIDLFKRLIGKFPTESWTSYLRLARVYKEAGDFERAITVFSSIPADNPLRERAQDNLFTLYFIINDHDRGIKNLREAIRRFGANHRRTKDLGRLYMKKGKKRDAIKWLREALKFDPDDDDARILIGLAYVDAGEYANARKTFKRILKHKKDSYPALINLAELDLRQNKLEDAKKIIMKIRRRDPYDSRSKLGLGEYWLKKGKPKKAIPITEEGLKETPFYYPLELVRAHDILGKAYAEAGDELKARVHGEVRKRLSAGQEPYSAMLQLAKDFASRGNAEFAEEILKELLETFPGNTLALVRMAEARFSRGMADGAIELCREALKAEDKKFLKDRIAAHRLLARIYRDLKQPARSREQEKMIAELQKKAGR